ncbi:hypothetical protein EXIGLDRAFT_122555 [Exidia glandulosa HHB12029]|uniref:Uncharacterized protein n=1 Tax=Exidia glandulosa HHB12029 TaxID=1314781 RepID=A0A165NIF2_EXIGL|nr:hypothetical protein EXIGLDRAFT_122555 [Exidia glandulosa HHB12029]
MTLEIVAGCLEAPARGALRLLRRAQCGLLTAASCLIFAHWPDRPQIQNRARGDAGAHARGHLAVTRPVKTRPQSSAASVCRKQPVQRGRPGTTLFFDCRKKCSDEKSWTARFAHFCGGEGSEHWSRPTRGTAPDGRRRN